MSEPKVDYAKRATQRKEARTSGRTSTMSTEERLGRQVKILADRLALALHMMSDTTILIEKATVADWMRHTEEWAQELAEEEPPPPGEGRPRKLDFYRKQKPYTYFMNRIRTMLRAQVTNPPEIQK